jgi:DNA helicase-2/ATP-dependent DNA helicase PcrA
MPDTADPSVSDPALAQPRPDPYASLNPEQRAAVEHDVGAAEPRPLLVVAGAGSGKTNTRCASVFVLPEPAPTRNASCY